MFVQLQNTYFFTATIFKWKNLLLNDHYKNIVISTLQFLVKENRVKIFAYVIMPNHIHLIWEINEGQTKNSTQGSLLRYTSQQIKFELLKSNPHYLENFRVNLKDREYQLWQRNPLSVEIFSQKMFEQKLHYIHLNPISKKWNLCLSPENYAYSSAHFYENNIDEYNILTSFYL